MRRFDGQVLNKIVALATMWSKYGIAVLVIAALNAWSFLPIMALTGLLALIVGVVLGDVLWQYHVWIKYVVIAIELFIFRASLLAPTFGIPAFAIWLSLPLVGNLVGEIRAERDREKLKKHVTMKLPEYHPRSLLVRIVDTVIFSEHMFAIERVFKFFLGLYFTWIFGLASVWNEAIILASFGIIGAVEMAPTTTKKTIAVCKHCKAFLEAKIKRGN